MLRLKEKYALILLMISILSISGCTSGSSSGASGSSAAPVLNDLVITYTDSTSITLAEPTFSTPGDPSPEIWAYIGESGTITVSGDTVAGELSSIEIIVGPTIFSGLTNYTSYKIIVIASNSRGYSVKEITQSTSGIAPVLNDLSILNFDSVSIELAQPTLSTAGYPVPAVKAYIGISGTISASGSHVANFTDGPVDVALNSGLFTELSPNTSYKIIVVAENTEGYSVKEITQSTSGIAPVLNNLAVSGFDEFSITLAKPTLSTAGNPTPAVNAYIGLSGSISASGSDVTKFTDGPIDVSSGSYQFSGLSINTSYKIIVVAQNEKGYSVQEITQSTDQVAPVLNNLAVSSFDAVSITLEKPTLATAGNPTPAVNAYIGLSGSISASGSDVTKFTDGPIDVSSGSYQFSGLSINTSYKIIVVAQNEKGYSVQEITQSTDQVAPVMNNLAVSGFDAVSITLEKPTFATAGNPTPAVNAYIGLSGSISASGSDVTNFTDGPIDVSSGSYQFSGLSINTSYKIIVVAQNEKGYSVQEITQSTDQVAPVMNNLAVSGFDAVSITLEKPTFATAGNPTPAVNAYIGLSGSISASGSDVTNFTDGPIDVSSGAHQFSGLSINTSYKIIVVAQNEKGYSVQEITQSTDQVAPVLNSLFISSSDSISITLAKPTLSTAGNPTPAVNAYIGLDGTMYVSGATVSNSLQGPIDVSGGNYQFSGLSSYTSYKIIVVAQNSKGYSTQEITQSTAGIAPVMNSLAISGYDSSSITLTRPSLSTTGNPLPTVQAYIGIDGTISVSGATVSNSLQGPADVSSGSYQFSGLNSATIYRIIVVAQNIAGSSVQQITKKIYGTTAMAVYGQDSFFSTSANMSSICLNGPRTIAVDAGGVYVADYYNHRVLYYSGTSTTASRVYGQGGSFTSSTANKGGISADSLNYPIGIAVDAGGVYIADSGNNRVLYYSGTSTTPTRVYGQGGSFTIGTENNGGISANSLCYPTGVAVDAGGVYIADSWNNRVLYYSGTSTTATRVYGQGGSFTTGTVYNGEISADSLDSPRGIAVDASGVYIADYYNHRVLYYSGTSTTATRVYGQGGSFTTGTTNNGGTSANSLFYTESIAVDADGVYISDSLNHRVLYYSGTSTTATRVYGQGGSFTTGTTNNGGTSANSLRYPRGIAVFSGGVYVADNENNRVLYYSGTSTTANRVYGQGGSFTSNTRNNGGTSANSLYYPASIAVDAGGVYIADFYNHRVLYYSSASTTATRVYGQGGIFTSGTANKDGTSANSLNSPIGIAVDAGGVYIADTYNNRVLYYSGTSTTATRVYGQNDSFTTGAANNGGIRAASLNFPVCIAVDAGGVYIVDNGNNRVLYYSGTSTTATRVYGQNGSFTTGTENNGGLSAYSLYSPRGIAVDVSGVYIVDYNNHRVLYYSGTSTTATRVYGQGGIFNSCAINNGGISANSLNTPSGIAVDAGGVYIADTYNNRVLYYSGASTTATRVYGQSGIFTTATYNKGGISADSLYLPRGIAVDAGGVYIADTDNNRVLWY